MKSFAMHACFALVRLVASGDIDDCLMILKSFQQPWEVSVDLDDHIQALSGLSMEERIKRDRASYRAIIFDFADFGCQPMFAAKWSEKDVLWWAQLDIQVGPFD